jgi:hypothetical protein
MRKSGDKRFIFGICGLLMLGRGRCQGRTARCHCARFLLPAVQPQSCSRIRLGNVARLVCVPYVEVAKGQWPLRTSGRAPLEGDEAGDEIGV